MHVLLVPSSNIKNTRVRCSVAQRYWSKGLFDIMILSGGTYPNASVMRQWILDHSNHIPDKIIIENKSLDTYQNISYSLKILKARFPGQKLTGIDVVTNWQHGTRCWLSLRRAGVENVHILSSREQIGLKQWMLEWALILIHFFDPKGDNIFARFNRAHRRLAR